MKRLYSKLRRWIFKKLNIMTAERFQEIGSGIGYGLNDLFSTTSTSQRSETMESYNLPEAMIKAKENPGTIYETEEDGISIQFLDSAGCWVKIDSEDEVMLYDHAFHELQSKIQAGDWLQDKTCGIYIKVLGSSMEPYAYRVRELGTNGDTHLTEIKARNTYEKVTDERALMFLNGGREPNEWKSGDIAIEDTVIGELNWVYLAGRRLYFKKAQIEPDSPLIKPVTFVEDRKDRANA